MEKKMENEMETVFICNDVVEPNMIPWWKPIVEYSECPPPHWHSLRVGRGSANAFLGLLAIKQRLTRECCMGHTRSHDSHPLPSDSPSPTA